MSCSESRARQVQRELGGAGAFCCHPNPQLWAWNILGKEHHPAGKYMERPNQHQYAGSSRKRSSKFKQGWWRDPEMPAGPPVLNQVPMSSALVLAPSWSNGNLLPRSLTLLPRATEPLLMALTEVYNCPDLQMGSALNSISTVW